jgi:hypothetical protein
MEVLGRATNQCRRTLRPRLVVVEVRHLPVPLASRVPQLRSQQTPTNQPSLLSVPNVTHAKTRKGSVGARAPVVVSSQPPITMARSSSLVAFGPIPCQRCYPVWPLFHPSRARLTHTSLLSVCACRGRAQVDEFKVKVKVKVSHTVSHIHFFHTDSFFSSRFFSSHSQCVTVGVRAQKRGSPGNIAVRFACC